MDSKCGAGIEKVIFIGIVPTESSKLGFSQTDKRASERVGDWVAKLASERVSDWVAKLASEHDAVLPKLPVPTLEHTMERYLAAVRPLVPESQYERTRSLVKNFSGPSGPGPRLQEKLLQRREQQDNWGCEAWVCQEKHKSRVDAVGMRYIRNVCGETLMDRVSNEWMLKECCSKGNTIGFRSDLVCGNLKASLLVLEWPDDGREVEGPDAVPPNMHAAMLGCVPIRSDASTTQTRVVANQPDPSALRSQIPHCTPTLVGKHWSTGGGREDHEYSYQWWLHDMYLNIQLPLPINSNPGYVLPTRHFRSAQDMARFAARMVGGVLKHKDVLDRRALPVERATSREKGQPLCMSQYYRLLTSYRCPSVTRDVIVSTTPEGEKEGGRTTPPPTGEHIIVSCRHQLYSLPVKTPDLGLMPEDEMTTILLAIMRDASAVPSPPPVGLFTSERRDTWAAAREQLVRNERNSNNLKSIEKSLMMVCIDDPLPTSFNCKAPRDDIPVEGRGLVAGDRDETNMMHQMLHGGGSSANSANRWFDVTIQLIISSDGACGLCYEHSTAEGVAVVQLVEDVLKQVDSQPDGGGNVSNNNPQLSPAVRLEWSLDQNLQRTMYQAAHNLDCLIEDLDLFVYRYNGYGKDFIKLYRHLTATYESASTRRFLLGRVDCIRSATEEALDWVVAMSQDDSGVESEDNNQQASEKVTFSLYTDEKKQELFDLAIKKQTEIMVENIMGEGIDIHLLGLREMARESGEPTPEIFQDEVYKLANHFALSTSQDGYGASYNPHTSCIVFCLSALNSCEHTSTWKFSHTLEESLNAMQKLLDI
uniref:Choline O-acetyltransferase n=1 Tax=Timema genevievae TaxID=629358 RepID=A0A7R9PHG5_TIMGE|nr:unnamed protein product [Timema genevievae]